MRRVLLAVGVVVDVALIGFWFVVSMNGEESLQPRMIELHLPPIRPDALEYGRLVRSQGSS